MQAILKVFVFLLAIIALLALIALTISSTVLIKSSLGLLIFASLILSICKPEISIALFLFLLPVFGNKPGTLQANYLLITGLALQLGLTIAFFSRKSLSRSPAHLKPAFCYVIISALSLFPVSFQIFWGWFRASQTSLNDLSLLSWNSASILLAREDDPAYPLLSVFWTSLAFSLSYFVCIFSSSGRQIRSVFCWALFAGFLCSLIVGLLNYYGVCSLANLRELDPVVNPGGTQYRLQSWFGHSGWFAEYVTMLAPFAMLVLTLALTFWTRVSMVLLLLLIGELVLILTFQRGGWLSYPPTLIAIWASIYVFRRLDRADSNILSALRSSALKIIISLPITLVISFLILKGFGSQFGLDQYASRFKDITKTADRSEFIKAGFSLGALSPILGRGSESFALQYRREYRKEDGAYFGQIDLPLHGTAHNLYAQTFAGKGALGLISLLLTIWFAVAHGLDFVLRSTAKTNRSDLIIALACVCSLLACFIYGFVQELFYVQSLQYVFFAMLGILASLNSEGEKESTVKDFSNVAIILCLTILFGTHLIWTNKISRSYSDPSGCFNEETSPSGEKWIWCGVRSSLDIPINYNDNKILTLETAPSDKKNPVRQLLTVKACNQIIFSKELAPSERASFPLNSQAVKCTAIRPGFIRLETVSGRYFIPAETDKASADRRVLAMRWISTS